jgi:hypothetical protein
MPESFREIVPRTVLTAAEKVIEERENPAHKTLNEEVARALLKMRVSYK